MTKELCHTFQMLATHTWKTIDAARSCGMRWSEESNTESLLLNLTMHHPKEIQIKAFSKKDEKVNGSDWEWWFSSYGAHYGMRVQAKRIKETTGTFGYLRYKSPSAPKGQMTNLIDEARSTDLTPAYCFYSATDEPSRNPAWPISNQPLTGCLIGHAEQVRDAHSNHLSDLNHLLMPWHCLVCPCASDDNRNIAHRAADAMRRTIAGKPTIAHAEEKAGTPWLARVRTQPPSYVSNLIDAASVDGISPDEIFRHPELSKRNIKGILVISENRTFERS